MSNQAAGQPDEQPSAYQRYLTPQFLLWTVLGIIVLLAIVLLPLFAQSNDRPLKPLRPTATPGSFVVEGEPLLIAFPNLNEDPFSYLNQHIRVTGDYTPLPPPDCTPFSGRRIRWALVAENLQMNAVGFERVLRLLPPDTTLTVEGIWRLYSGPAGCGKEAPRANVWYLEVERIIQPNPLTGVTRSVGSGPVVPVTPASPGTTPADGTEIPTATPTATTITTPVLTPSPSATVSTPTATMALPGTGTTTATATETDIATEQPTATFTPPSASTPIPETPVPTLETGTPDDSYPAPDTPTPTPTGPYP